MSGHIWVGHLIILKHISNMYWYALTVSFKVEETISPSDTEKSMFPNMLDTSRLIEDTSV